MLCQLLKTAPANSCLPNGTLPSLNWGSCIYKISDVIEAKHGSAAHAGEGEHSQASGMGASMSALRALPGPLKTIGTGV